MEDRRSAAETAPDGLRAGRESGSTRRGWIAAGAAGAVWLAAGRAHARSSGTFGASSAGPHGAQTPSANGDLRFLVERISYGRTPELWQRAQTLGYQGFLEEQLAPASIDDSALDQVLAQSFPTLSMSSKAIWDLYGATNQFQIPVNQLKQATIVRAVRSKRQLLERMVEFWSDHFNMDHGDGEVRILKTADDRDVIRAHALGRFPDLLEASMHSGAMLYYLDNYSSRKEAPNENYARELLELHALGVGNFTELDVREVARCLTGWSRWPASFANYGDFRYIPNWHDEDSKTVLGVGIPANGGENDGNVVHAILATHPSTAVFVGRKLARWLLAYEPPQAVVDATAQAYLATGGDIKAMIRTILEPANVHAGGEPRLRRPFHLVASLLRATGAPLNQPAQLVTRLTLLGHAPFAWPTPDGYPDSLEAWGSALLPRWAFASSLCAGQVAGSPVDVATLFAGVPQSSLAAHVGEILGGTLGPAEIAEVQAYVNSFGVLNDALRREALALGASCPGFQYH